MPKKCLSCSIPKLIDQNKLKRSSLAVHSLPNDTFLSFRSQWTVQTATRLILEHLFQSSPLSFDLCQQRQRDRLARSELLTLKNTDRRLRRSARSAIGHATGGRISISTQHLHWLCRLCHGPRRSKCSVSVPPHPHGDILSAMNPIGQTSFLLFPDRRLIQFDWRKSTDPRSAARSTEMRKAPVADLDTDDDDARRAAGWHDAASSTTDADRTIQQE